MISAVTFKTQPAAMRRLQEGVGRIPQRMQAEFKQAFRDWGEDWRGKMLERFRGGDGELHTRSGGLKRSLDGVVTGRAISDMKLRLTSAGVLYARLQEYGGTVRPKNARFLCIPTEANKTAAGVARYASPRAFIAAHPGETFFLRKNGKLLIMWKNPTAAVRKSGKGGKGEAVALWYLVRSVTIPPRLGFHETWKGLARTRQVRLAKIARSVRSFA